jgi:ubiquinone/menaquinone biosynthesis C-methylase UbiE
MVDKQMGLNPFEDPSVVRRYEDWYSDPGLRADRLEKRLLEWLIDHFGEPTSILEVGCGTGHFTRWFQSLGLNAVGLDLSPIMLAEARRHGLPIAVQANALHLPFRAGAFDLVALITTLEFLCQPRSALREATRVARKGLVLGAINRKSWTGRAYQGRDEPPWRGADFFTPKELLQMLGSLEVSKAAIFWRTTLWRHLPWALPLPWGGFIGAGMSFEDGESSRTPSR